MRTPEADVDPLFVERWSRRAFADRPIPAELRATLFEAARWAPSCGNEQPWLFLYADSVDDRAAWVAALDRGNAEWASRAPLLAFLVARTTWAKDGAPNPLATFDAGAAWMSLALQAHLLGLSAHAMGGFSAERAREALGLPREGWEICCAIAVGWPGDPEILPEHRRASEVAKGRKPLAEVAVGGRFPGSTG